MNSSLAGGRYRLLRHSAVGPAAGIALAGLLLGAPLGLLWNALAPHAALAVVPGGVDLVDPETKDFLTADLLFALLALVSGLVFGAVVAQLVRPGPQVVVGVVLGGLLAAGIAARTGQLAGQSGLPAVLLEAVRQGRAAAPFRLRAQVAVLAWPLGGVLGLAWTLLRAGISSD